MHVQYIAWPLILVRVRRVLFSTLNRSNVFVDCMTSVIWIPLADQLRTPPRTDRQETEEREREKKLIKSRVFLNPDRNAQRAPVAGS